MQGVEIIVGIQCFEPKDQEIANKMFENLKYLLDKYRWLEVYEYCWRTMANKMCGNVEGRCTIIFNRKHWAYTELRQENEKIIKGVDK